MGILREIIGAGTAYLNYDLQRDQTRWQIEQNALLQAAADRRTELILLGGMLLMGAFIITQAK
jgi:hypothetical protein